MNAGAVSERVYAGVKRRILERQYRPGDRLDPATLGEALNSSVTPVRDALHRLAGERLIEARTSEGFHLPRIDLAGLNDLYRWTQDIVTAAVRSWREQPAGAVPPPCAGDDTALVAATAAAFAAIGQRSTNVEHRDALAAVNDRLHAVRLAEIRVLNDVADEIDGLHAAIAAGSATMVRQRTSAYHRRRHRRGDEIVWTLYRNGAPR